MGLFHKHQHPELPRGYDREKLRTSRQRTEDLAYTLNHAIACTITDFIDPEVSKFVQNHGAKYAPNWMQPYLAKFRIGCGCNHHHGHDHDHSHEHDHHHDHHHNVSRWQVYVPELVADFGSVPVVLAFQRYAPGLMHGIESAIEPFAGKAFHKSAELHTKRWAKRNGVPYNSLEYNQHVEDIYHHEMEHLPQALIWTISTIGINAAAQKAMGSKSSWGNAIAGKTVGAIITSAGVVTARVVAPKGMQKFDQWTTKNIVGPGTRIAGNMMGLDSNVVEKVIAEHEENTSSSWQDRTTKQDDSTMEIMHGH